MSGLSLAKNIGYKLCEGGKISDTNICESTLQDVEEILHDKFGNDGAIFVAWQIQNIIWGTYDGKLLLRDKKSLEPENWLECRVFNAEQEVHFKRVGNKLRWRYIKDTLGEGNFYVDSFSRLWGEKISAADGYIKLLDRQRKLYMEIPCDKTNAKWYGLLTRNYIESDVETGLSGYVDYRFVAIEPAGGADNG